jgi:hypothetical protein
MSYIRHITVMLAGLAGATLAFSQAAPPRSRRATTTQPGRNQSRAPPAIHTVVIGGTPSWQIALIAAGATLLTAALAVTADRMRAARRRVTRHAT